MESRNPQSPEALFSAHLFALELFFRGGGLMGQLFALYTHA